MKQFCILLFIISKLSVYAQQPHIPSEQLRLYEDTLRQLGHRMIYDYNEENRRKASYDIIKLLVKSLKTPNSFQYNFDSVPYFMITKPTDNTFRIITWQTELNPGQYRHFGCIQMNNSQLKLFPLIDKSDEIAGSENDTILDKNAWLGCVYYRIIQQKIKGREHYFLFGYDAYTSLTSRKLIDVLTFDKKSKEPIFGAPTFTFESKKTPDSKAVWRVQNRFVLQYKSDASVSLNYDENEKKIIYDHLEKITGGFKGKGFSFVPDGTYEAFSFKKGKWVHENMLPINPIKESELPMPER